MINGERGGEQGKNGKWKMENEKWVVGRRRVES
jgi:hypothetical protein